VFADLDDDPATGGAPSTLGLSTSFQGAELVTRVSVLGPIGDEIVTPTVWRFQGGTFVEITDRAIDAQVFAPREGETGLPLPHVVTIQLPNAVRGPMGDEIRIQAIAERVGGERDQLPNEPADGGVPLFVVPPSSPCAG
jgi:hypothetical protein